MEIDIDHENLMVWAVQEINTNDYNAPFFGLVANDSFM